MALAIVTGGTSGIGFQIARRLRDRGYALFIQGLADDHLRKAKSWFEREAKASPRPLPSVTFLGIDLAKPNATTHLYDAATHYADQQHHRIEVLINSAGFGLFGEHAQLSQAQVTQMLQVNVVALTNLCQTFAQPFSQHPLHPAPLRHSEQPHSTQPHSQHEKPGKEQSQQKNGYILNIASTTAFQPLPFLSAYAGSKAYVKQFSQALAQELEGSGINVCCLCPGATNTPFLRSTGLDESNRYSLGQVLNHFAMDPAAVADAGLAGLFAGKKLVTPGLINKGHYQLSRQVPEYIASKLGRLLLKPKPEEHAEVKPKAKRDGKHQRNITDNTPSANTPSKPKQSKRTTPEKTSPAH